MTSEFIYSDDSRWLEFLNKTPHDVYHLPEYVSFAAKYEGGEAVAYFAADNERSLLIPLLVKTLPQELNAAFNDRDAFSPYGYPGPLFHGESGPTVTDRMWQNFVDLASASGFIAVFLRIHPLLPVPWASLQKVGALINHGQTVSCDLAASQDAMWAQTSQNHRRNIKKLLKNGFVTVRNDWSHWSRFMEVYRETMQRVGAGDFYLFSDHYFADLKSALGARLDLWTVLSPEGKYAAGGLFTVTNGIVEYHLGGTAEAFLSIAPSKLMFSEVRDWAKREGHRWLHLGGGLGAAADSLFQFKAGFSSNRSNFYTLRIIIDRGKYACLEAKRRLLAGGTEPGSFFPAYRNGFFSIQ